MDSYKQISMTKLLLINQESERLRFRKIQHSDFSVWLTFHQDPRTSQYWEGLPLEPKTACQQDFERTFYRYQNNLGGKLALTLKETGNIVGLCGLLVQEVDGKKELEIAYSRLPKYWKHGYAIEAATACKEYAQANKLSNSLISIVHVDNIPSQKVAIKNGMDLDTSTDYNGNPVHIYRIAI
jgi:RimJ/RimL family protein N-acetyltransferase